VLTDRQTNIRQTNTQTDTTENNTTLAVRAVTNLLGGSCTVR